jgi:hypothetical protein
VILVGKDAEGRVIRFLALIEGGEPLPLDMELDEARTLHTRLGIALGLARA